MESVICSAYLTTRKETKPTGAKHSNQVASRVSRLRYLTVGISPLHGGEKTNVGAIVGRRPYFSRVALVSAPPSSTSGEVKTNVREEIERRGTWAAPALRFRPAGFTKQAEQNERWRNT